MWLNVNVPALKGRKRSETIVPGVTRHVKAIVTLCQKLTQEDFI